MRVELTVLKYVVRRLICSAFGLVTTEQHQRVVRQHTSIAVAQARRIYDLEREAEMSVMVKPKGMWFESAGGDA